MASAAANSSNTFNATLKGKVAGLEQTTQALIEELNFYSEEIKTLRSEKQELE